MKHKTIFSINFIDMDANRRKFETFDTTQSMFI